MPNWRRILVATDFSRAARVALRSAGTLANEVKGTLHVVHAVEPLPPRYKLLVGSFGTPELDAERIAYAERRLERLLRRMASSKAAVEGEVRLGHAWEEILEAAVDVEADLIVLGNSGHSPLERLLLGATAENVARRSEIPVLVTRRRALQAVHRILVPIDFDEASAAALRFARDTFPRRAQIEALYVLPPPPPVPEFVPFTTDEGWVEGAVRDFLRKSGVERTRHAVYIHGDPANQIVRHARRRRADLVIVSTHGRRGLPRFLMGSVAEKVLRHCEAPVLVLPGPGRARSRRSRAA